MKERASRASTAKKRKPKNGKVKIYCEPLTWISCQLNSRWIKIRPKGKGMAGALLVVVVGLAAIDVHAAAVCYI